MGLGKSVAALHRLSALADKGPGPAGSVMVGLILAIMMTAAIGVAMLSVTGSGWINPVDAIRAAQAASLAEAGYRYVEREFRNVSDSDSDGDKEDDTNLAFAALHNQGRVLRDDQGRFDIGIYPYYVMTSQSHSAGATSLAVRFPGGQPSEKNSAFSISKIGYIKIGSDYYNYSNFSYDTGTGLGSFTLPALIRSLDPQKNILFAARLSVAGNLNQNGNLTIPLTSSMAFPLKNGTFTFKSIAGTFRYNNRNGATLQNITDRDNPEREFSVTITAGEMVALEPFVDIYSTGTYGVAPETVQRETVFHVPIPTEQKKQFLDTFDDSSSLQKYWNQEDATGTFQVESGALKAATVVTASGITGAQIALKPDATGLGLDQRYNETKYLSYDAQVKLGFANASTAPLQGYDDYLNQGPVPKYFGGGLSFRLSGSTYAADTMGLSLLRADNAATPNDALPSGIVPTAKKGRPLLVLWQKIGSTFTWLAYKELLLDPVFSDDFETTPSVWTTSGTPNADPVKWRLYTNPIGGNNTKKWYYGESDGYGYDYRVFSTSFRSFGYLISPSVTLTNPCAIGCYHLYFDTLHETEPTTSFDWKRVQFSTDNGATWPLLFELIGNQGSWRENAFVLNNTDYLSKTIKMRYYFDTRDDFLNFYMGWYIDDTSIQYATIPRQNQVITVVLRLIEGASVRFQQQSGTVEIKNGDIVNVLGVGTARVKGDPILESGAWKYGTSPGNAIGTLVLEKVAAPYSAGQTMTVVGSTTTLTILSYSSRGNYIQAFLGLRDADPVSPCANPTTADPLDVVMRSNVRGSANWPPDSLGQWTTGNDYFRLVKWDAVNTGASFVTAASNSTQYQTIVRSSQAEFLTPAAGSYSQPELGLHTLGDGAKNVFFDDFAVQVPLEAKAGFPYTTQE